jgi:alcohol dehydrogenase
MRAAVITEYGKPLEVTEVPDPVARPHGVVLEVGATGICLSDWHAWMGHEQLPSLPHVPGHEMAGTVAEVGDQVTRWRPGDRVTLPFSTGCGECRSCREGHLNTCDRGFTPGFSHWGSYAQKVAIAHADVNLVRLPDSMDWAHAAALGCRFVTAFRAVVDRGRLSEGDWLAVHGCGGVGLSAVMIGAAFGARVVAVDIHPRALAMATDLGAEFTVDASATDPARAVVELTGGGADVSLDAVGRVETALASIGSLRKHGRHVQVGLLLGDQAVLPIVMDPVIMGEIELLGSRGMPASDYPRVLESIAAGRLDPGRLVTGTVDLGRASEVLEHMGEFSGVGVTVIDSF